MPKIIENVRHQLLTEAKRQISERGYKSTTIRSVAAECGVAVGTVYNYFKSKDILIASFILEDACLESICDPLPGFPPYSFTARTISSATAGGFGNDVAALSR